MGSDHRHNIILLRSTVLGCHRKGDDVISLLQVLRLPVVGAYRGIGVGQSTCHRDAGYRIVYVYRIRCSSGCEGWNQSACTHCQADRAELLLIRVGVSFAGLGQAESNRAAEKAAINLTIFLFIHSSIDITCPNHFFFFNYNTLLQKNIVFVADNSVHL